MRARTTAAMLILCFSAASAEPESHRPWLTPPISAAEAPPAPWRVLGLPRQSKPYTRFSVLSLEGQRVLRIEAQASYGNLAHTLVDLPAGSHKLTWRWRLDEPNPASDLLHKTGDDSPAKVCAMFDLPLPALPFMDRQLLRIARLSAGEHLPSASVCYVWDSHLKAGTSLDNAFTRRIREIVLRGPDAPLHQWVWEQRDLAADFLLLFGDETSTVPPLVGVAIGADADNTQTRSVAFLASITLE